LNFKVGDTVTLALDRERRDPIEAHHTATHLLHWALHEVVSPDATQQGSSVSTESLRFDFNSKALDATQITALEDRVNACIQKAESVSWSEVPHAEVKDRADVMQFFGDKYGEQVRVVQIGGQAQALDGYSMELCGGTHVRNTAKIGLFKIKSEGAIAAGIRRIEAFCGKAAQDYLQELEALEAEAHSTQLTKLEKLNEALVKLDREALAVPADASSDELKALAVEAEKALKKAQSSAAAGQANALLDTARTLDSGLKVLVTAVEAPDPNALRSMAGSLAGQLGESLVVLGAAMDGKISLCAQASPKAIEAGHQAGAIIRELTGQLGGKGGGKDNFAMGGAPDNGTLNEVLQAFDPS
jgi:alanyl-tRNA synthetase